MAREQRGRSVLAITGLAAIATALVVVPALPGVAAPVPPFDATLSGSCAPNFFGGGPQGALIEKSISVTGSGSVRTVDTLITFPGFALPPTALVDCIAIGNTDAGLVESISLGGLTAASLPTSFTVGLQGSGADITIQEGDRICDAVAANRPDAGGISAIFCSEPITFGDPTTTTTTTAAATTTTALPTTTTAPPTTTTTTTAATTTTTAATTTTTAQATTTTTMGGATTTTQAPTTTAETTTSVASSTSVGDTTTTGQPTTTEPGGTTTVVAPTSTLPSTGGGLNSNVLAAAVLTLLAGALALVVARRQAM